MNDLDYINEEYLTECCGAPVLGEVVEGLGLCSRCGEWAEVSKDPEFENEENE